MGNDAQREGGGEESTRHDTVKSQRRSPPTWIHARTTYTLDGLDSPFQYPLKYPQGGRCSPSGDGLWEKLLVAGLAITSDKTGLAASGNFATPEQHEYVYIS